MVTGPMLLVILVLGIAAIILLISKLKLHPFIALVLVAYLMALAAGVPLVDKTVEGVTTPGIAKVITTGFGNTMTSIGIVILLGTIIGAILEKSGGAVKMADVVVKTVGKKHPGLAMSIIGYIVSIPVFCDSGFVILNPFKKALARKTGVSAAMMSVALATGLYATHVMVPPTPGPIAAAANLGLENSMLWVILLGMAVSIPSIIIGYIYATKVSSKFTCGDDTPVEGDDYDALLAKFGKLPSAFLSFAPIVLPILLMALGSISSMAKWSGWFGTLCSFLGTPVNALMVGFLFSLTLLPKFDKETLSDWLADALKAGGNIIIITAAGGALGNVLAVTGIGQYLGTTLANGLNIGILVPFLVAAAIKTAQGSSTVAIVTTSSLMFPMMASLGLESHFAHLLTVMAIGAGSMTVSHANDSFYWVITEFSGLEVKDSYRAWTLATLVQGIGTMVVIWVLALFA